MCTDLYSLNGKPINYSKSVIRFQDRISDTHTWILSQTLHIFESFDSGCCARGALDFAKLGAKSSSRWVLGETLIGYQNIHSYIGVKVQTPKFYCILKSECTMYLYCLMLSIFVRETLFDSGLQKRCWMNFRDNIHYM